MIVSNSMIPEPVIIDEKAGLWDLINQLLASGQDTAPVVNRNNKLVGVVGIHDVFSKIVPEYIRLDEKLMSMVHEGYFEEKFRKFEGVQAGDLMKTEIDWVEPTDAVFKAVALFVKHRRRALPVREKDGTFVGLITRKSILRRLHYKLNKVEEGS